MNLEMEATSISNLEEVIYKLRNTYESLVRDPIEPLTLKFEMPKNYILR